MRKVSLGLGIGFTGFEAFLWAVDMEEFTGERLRVR